MKKKTIKKRALSIDKSTSKSGKRAAIASVGILPERNYWNVEDAADLPSFPKEIYASLPYVLKSVCSLVDTEERDMVLVGSLAAVSSTLYNVCGTYNYDTIYPPLYALIEADAGAGKGQLKLCRQLIEQVLNERPIMLAADITVPEFVDTLQAQGGVGFLFNTEIDLLKSSLRGANGLKMSAYLRQAFTRDEISHQTKRGTSTVELPKLAVLISGTFDQMSTLFQEKDFNNGLFTRFLIYHREMAAKTRNNLDFVNKKAQPVKEMMDNLSTFFHECWKRLQEEAGSYNIRSMEGMGKLLADWGDMRKQQAADCGWANSLVGLINRYSEIVWRIAMTLTILKHTHRRQRKPQQEWQEEVGITARRRDFQTALDIVDTLFWHGIFQLRIMEEKKKHPQKPSKKDENWNNAIAILELMPTTFTQKKYVDTAMMKLHIEQRTAYRRFERLQEAGKIKQINPRKWKRQ